MIWYLRGAILIPLLVPAAAYAVRTLGFLDPTPISALLMGSILVGGVPYVAGLLGIDPKTIRQGEADLKNLPDVPPEDVRKKGAAERRKSKKFLN